MNLTEATRQYQAALEHARTYEDHFNGYLSGPDELQDAWTAIDEAERAMNTAWLEHTTR